jgi:hypothetical protein
MRHSVPETTHVDATLQNGGKAHVLNALWREKLHSCSVLALEHCTLILFISRRVQQSQRLQICSVLKMQQGEMDEDPTKKHHEGSR